MKYTILLTALLATSAQAWEYNQQSFGMKPNTPQNQMWNNMIRQQQRPRVTHTMPNIHGGEDFYGNRGFMGHTMPNIHGGRDFYSGGSW